MTGALPVPFVERLARILPPDVYPAALASFSEPRPVKTGVEGACQCCSMAGALGEEGRVYLTFRNSTDVEGTSTKDSYLLTSTDGGTTFDSRLLEPWELAGCPGSNVAIVAHGACGHVAWRTHADVRVAAFSPASEESHTDLETLTGSSEVNARVPILARSVNGEVLCAWVVSGGPKARGGGPCPTARIEPARSSW